MNNSFAMFQIAQAAGDGAVLAPATDAATTAEIPVGEDGAADSATQQQPMGGLMGNQMMIFVLIMAIFYFIMIRPAQRKEKERKKEINELRADTKVMFGGGMLGTIKEVKPATFMVEVADGVVVEIARGAVQRTVKDGEIPVADAN